MAPDNRTEQIGVRVSPALKSAAEKAAAADHRSLSSLVEKLITEHCQKEGLLKTVKK